MKKEVCDLKVMNNTRLNHDNFLIELKPKSSLDSIKPGQFVNILVNDSPGTYLRRPFSIHDVNYSSNTFSVLVKTVGNGTVKLSMLKEQDSLSVIYPLGNGFTLPEQGDKILLVGGGVGIAPMMLMARESLKLGAEVHILLGARSELDHILLDEFNAVGTLHLTTDDGTLGAKGFVTQHEVMSEKWKFDRFYCCGPEPMMHAVAKRAKTLKTGCEVSLENMMACGFGVCLCCVTKTHDGNKCVCTEGPVFNINDLQWQI